MNKLIKTCIAMAAFAAFLVVPSMASAVPQLFETSGSNNTSVPVGTNIIATNVQHAATSNITKFTGAGGVNVECQTATLTGPLITNTGTHIVGEITTAEFRNHASAACSSGLGNVTVTPSHTSIPSHNGVPALPLCVTSSGNKDEFEVFGKAGGSCDSGQRGPVGFELDTAIAGKCYYQTPAALKGTYTTHPADAILTLNPTSVPRVTGSGFCPASGVLDMAFTLTTDNAGTSGAALNIT